MPKLPFGDIGPCEVHWGYGYQSGDMPQIITPYLGKVMLRIADTVTDIHEEGKGVAPIDSFFEGTTVELEVPMTRSDLIQLAQTIGWQKMGILSASGYVLRLDNIAGEEMYAFAETIIIKPLCNNVPDPDPHNWIELYKCHPYREIELGFDRSGQRIHLVKFKVFPSRDSGYEGAGGGGQYLQEGMEAFEVTSANKYIDIYKGTEYVTNGTFEDWSSPTDLDDWTESLSGMSTINREAAEVHAGAYSLKFDIDASKSLVKETQAITLIPASPYSLTFWYKGSESSGTLLHLSLVNSGNNKWLNSGGGWENMDSYDGGFTVTSTTTWTKKTVNFSAHASYSNYNLAVRSCPHGHGNASCQVYTDNVSIFGDAAEYNATLTEGNYTGATLATEIKTRLDAAGSGLTFTVTYDTSTRKFTIASASNFSLLWKTGTHGSDNIGNHAGTLIGFDDSADDTGANSYISDWEVPP